MSPFPRIKEARSGAASRGIALVVTLALLAIASVMLIAFVTNMQSDRFATFSYSQSIKAEQLGRGSLQRVVAELQNELAKDALPDTGQGAYPAKPVYTNVVSANLLPQTVGGNPAMPNLVKISTNAPAFSGVLSSGTLQSTPVSSTALSQNGRSVQAARWNRVYLGTFPNAASAPYWVMMTRSGPTNAASAAFGPAGQTLNNAVATNPNYAIGRFAYAVYDIGGLLDINAVGYPTSLGLGASQLKAIKGSLAGVDLSTLGIDPGALTAWRNQASGASAAAYLKFATNFAATNGFRAVYPGDTAFLSRQDLIEAAQDGKAGLTTAVLTNLTVFSRERNSPAWGPATNAPAGGAYNYANLANQAGSTNRFIPNVRFSSDLSLFDYHDDGSSFSVAVKKGDPVVYRRFSLARMNWIGRNGPQNGGTTANIQACFGLAWDATAQVWRYVGASGVTVQSSVKTLAATAAENRQPDFFELLQAAILSGSLGVDNKGYGNLAVGLVIPSDFQKSQFLQVLQIGANLIDQYDADSYPTVLVGNYLSASVRICGSESLPHFNYFKDVAGVSPDDASSLASYLLLSLWNPYDEDVTPAAGDIPRIRVQAQGGYSQSEGWSPDASATFPFLVRSSTIQGAIEIPAASYPSFKNTAPLTSTLVPSAGSATLSWAKTPAITGVSYVGFRMPDVRMSPARAAIVNAQSASNLSRSQSLVTSLGATTAPFAFTVEFLGPGGAWIPYSYSSGIDDPTSWRVSTLHYTGNSPTATGIPATWAAKSFNDGAIRFKVDPRSIRFNEGQYNPVTYPIFLQPLSTLTVGGAFQMTPLLFSGNWTDPWSPQALVRNNGSASTESYKDLDGVQRIADAGLFTGSYAQNTPYATAANRPKILNRPFYSVAEMGYAYRDSPWKSLDFFTQNSSDAGLLEAFSLTEQPAVRAGVLDLNSRNTAVLSAVLGNTSLAGSLASATAANPLVNRAALASLAQNAFTSLGSIKSDREGPARTLADLGQTRTWNLLIDLVVQAGRYAPNATALPQFIVEGERRYWLHLALDRYTGEVVDQQLETVYDF